MHWWGGGWREMLSYSKSQTKWERLTSFSWVWWVRLRFSESPVSGGRRVKKLKERKKGINRVDFTPHSTIQSYGLACDGDGQEGRFELTLIWVFEMATHSTVLAWRIPGMGKPGGLPSMELQRVGHTWGDLAAAAAASIWNWRGPSLRNRCSQPQWLKHYEFLPRCHKGTISYWESGVEVAGFGVLFHIYIPINGDFSINRLLLKKVIWRSEGNKMSTRVRWVAMRWQDWDTFLGDGHCPEEVAFGLKSLCEELMSSELCW